MKWKIEKGTIEAEIGGSSEDIRLSGAFEIVENGWVAGRDRAFYASCDAFISKITFFFSPGTSVILLNPASSLTGLAMLA